VRPEACATFEPLLVEYADGELPEAEAQAVRAHLEACAQCRVMVAALNKSLGLAQAIWTVGAARTAPRQMRRWPLRWAGLAAAAVLLALGARMLWNRGHRGPVPTPVAQEITPEQAELVAARAGVSAQMLGAADYLAENGAAELARERFAYVVDAYPETDAAGIARSRLQTERGVR
jgi:anti-sigma factor RsiW